LGFSEHKNEKFQSLGMTLFRLSQYGSQTADLTNRDDNLLTLRKPVALSLFLAQYHALWRAGENNIAWFKPNMPGAVAD